MSLNDKYENVNKDTSIDYNNSFDIKSKKIEVANISDQALLNASDKSKNEIFSNRNDHKLVKFHNEKRLDKINIDIFSDYNNVNNVEHKSNLYNNFNFSNNNNKLSNNLSSNPNANDYSNTSLYIGKCC